MYRIFFLIVTGLVLTFHAEAKKVEGKILFENDTIDVTFKIPVIFFKQTPHFERLQYKVKYYDSFGEKKILRPGKAKEIQFNFENETIRMLSRNYSPGLGQILLLNTNIFLKLEMDGKLKLFSFYSTENSSGMQNTSAGSISDGHSYTEVNYLLQKGDDELKRIRELFFKKDMAEYLSDCPALTEKIESGGFRKNDLKNIVQFYNSDCR